jgi:hypothetical protein
VDAALTNTRITGSARNAMQGTRVLTFLSKSIIKKTVLYDKG